MSQVRRSIFLSFGQNYISFVLQFLASIIIARLLTPAEIGIYSVAVVLIGFAHRLRDFGAASYVIQEKDLTPDKIRSAFAMTLITAWIMAAVIGLGSGYAAEFYREPGIRSVMLVLCLNFILIPFGTVPMAYMQRQMDFQHIALINVISNVLSTVASVGLAYMGFSYLALAWGSVAGIVCNMALAQVWRPKELPFLPGFREIRKVFSFGSLSSLVMILSEMNDGVSNLILGRLSGMSVVGYFGRASGLVSMFDRFVMSALWSVALPHFAEQSRNKGAVKDSFLRSMTYATVLAWPFFSCLGLLAHPIILILYGSNWEPSVTVLQLLCVSMMLSSPFLLAGSMMTAIGQMKQNLYLLAIHVPIRILLIYLAAPFGLKAVGAVMIVSNLVGAVVTYFQCRIILDVGLSDIAAALYESAGVTFMAAIPPLMMLLFTEGFLADKLWLQLFLGLTSCMLGWVAGLFLFKHPMRVEIGQSLLIAKKAMRL
ncbi:MAG: lipopolysaccharide biosynthesis protein [Burkholderiales bacterium]|nr:lipopolysaccharide biosynthesis protein [Burkholderiales bacterium]